jgi:hypothetical protein
MRCEPDQCFALNQGFSNAQRNSKTISGASSAAKFIDDSETGPIDVSGQPQISTYKWWMKGIRPNTYLRMNAVSLISDAKVETFASMLSSIDTRANSWRIMGKEAVCAGTKQPTWAITLMRAIDRM